MKNSTPSLHISVSCEQLGRLPNTQYLEKTKLHPDQQKVCSLHSKSPIKLTTVFLILCFLHQIDTCGKFSPCGQQAIERIEQGDSCFWDPMKDQCHNLHSSCGRHDGGSCKWFQTHQLMTSQNCTRPDRKVSTLNNSFRPLN